MVKTRPGVSVVSSVFLMCLADRVLVYGDCAVNPKPTPSSWPTSRSARPRRRRSSASSRAWRCSPTRRGSPGKGAEVDAVREATELVRAARARSEGRGADPVRRRGRRRAWPRRSCRRARSRARRRCSSSPTSTPATSPTRRCSARPARWRSARCSGTEQAGQRSLARLHGRGHRQHRRDHGHPGPGGERSEHRAPRWRCPHEPH